MFINLSGENDELVAKDKYSVQSNRYRCLISARIHGFGLSHGNGNYDKRI